MGVTEESKVKKVTAIVGSARKRFTHNAVLQFLILILECGNDVVVVSFFFRVALFKCGHYQFQHFFVYLYSP